MKNFFFSLTALLMFSVTSVAKTIEIEPTLGLIENNYISEQNSNLEEITICWEVSRTDWEGEFGMVFVTIRYRCTEYPNSGLGNGTVYINAQ